MAATAAVPTPRPPSGRGFGVAAYVTATTATVTANKRGHHPFMSDAGLDSKQLTRHGHRKARFADGDGGREGRRGDGKWDGVEYKGGGGRGQEQLGPLRPGRRAATPGGYTAWAAAEAAEWDRGPFPINVDAAKLLRQADGPAAVVNSGAVGAYIRKTMPGRQSAGDKTPSPIYSDPGPGGVGGVGGHCHGLGGGGGGNESGWLRGDAQARVDAAVRAAHRFHKSPNAAVDNRDPFQRSGKDTGGAHTHAGGGGVGGRTVWAVPPPGGGGGGAESSLIGGGHRNLQNPNHVGVLDGSRRTRGPGIRLSSIHHTSSSRVLTRYPQSSPAILTSATTSATSSIHQHHEPFKPTFKFNGHRESLLYQAGGGGGHGLRRLSPLPVGSTTSATPMAVGATRTNTIPMLAFSDRYAKTPMSTAEHRTLPVNLGAARQHAKLLRPLHPDADDAQSATAFISTTPNLAGSDDGSEFRSRMGSVSSELSPGMKQLLRRSPTPKRGEAAQRADGAVKRRKVEFRTESPEVCDGQPKQPVTAISNKLDRDRPALTVRNPPKSILKKRDDRTQTGQIRFAKKYQGMVEPQSSFKLPSINIDGGAPSLTGKNTKINGGRNMNFTCSREFAAAFENINDDKL